MNKMGEPVKGIEREGFRLLLDGVDRQFGPVPKVTGNQRHWTDHQAINDFSKWQRPVKSVSPKTLQRGHEKNRSGTGSIAHWPEAGFRQSPGDGVFVEMVKVPGQIPAEPPPSKQGRLQSSGIGHAHHKQTIVFEQSMNPA